MSAAKLGVSVTARSLIPAEVPTSRKLLQRADCYQQVGIKYPQRGTFHSYAELLHFSLNDGDATVTTHVPQPFAMRVGRYPYVPDAYVVRGGVRFVIELKPRGEFAAELHQPLQAFFHDHGLQFVVVSNEEILAREIEALNWLQVIRTLHSARDIDTAALERALWRDFLVQERYALADLLDRGDRQGGFAREVALYRLLHRGRLRALWLHARLGPDTVLERWT